MEDITAALCLDNRLWRQLQPTLLAKRGNHGISVFIRPMSSSSFSLPASLFSTLLFCSLLILQQYSLCANGSCLQGGHQIHYQVGQQFPHCFTHTVYYKERERLREKEEARDGGRSFSNQILSQLKHKLNTIIIVGNEKVVLLV